MYLCVVLLFFVKQMTAYELRISDWSSDVCSSDLAGTPAMLKLSRDAEARDGWVLLDWWDGDGAARVLARDGAALLLERATGTASLSDMARSGADRKSAV